MAVVTSHMLGAAFYELLQSWAAPTHLTGFRLEAGVNDIVKVTLRYNAAAEDGQLLHEGDAFVETLKQYCLTEITTPEIPMASELLAVLKRAVEHQDPLACSPWVNRALWAIAQAEGRS